MSKIATATHHPATEAPNRKSEMTTATEDAIAPRLQDLHELAKTDSAAARQGAWELVQDVATGADTTELDSLFAHGTAPRNLDGLYEGEIVHVATGIAGPPLRAFLGLGWKGKVFDAAQQCGDNVVSHTGRLTFAIGWPVYRGIRRQGERNFGFHFKTSIGPSAHLPHLDVLNIDYVRDNPPMIRILHDELVELVPGVYFGTGTTKGADRPVGYWALRSDAGSPRT